MGQIMAQAELIGLRRGARPGGRKWVLTNGCFDGLHGGHVDTIQFAASQGDVLVVAVDTDEAVRALKGPHRPIQGCKERMEIVAALAGVDYVTSFGTAAEPSVEPLVAALAPEVLAKGGDYRLDEVVGGAIVTHAGGRVVLAPVREGVSSTKLHQKRREGLEGREGCEGSEGCACPISTPRSAIDWVLVDLDGVLVDFVGSMARVLGRRWDPAACRGEYDPGKLFGCDTDLFSVFGADFWETADWMPDGKRIWDVVRAAVQDGRKILICSSPTHETGSVTGKLRWIERELGGAWTRQYVFTPRKEALARPGVLLIDDCDAVVQAFEAAGGSALLVPRPWNSMHGWSGPTDWTAYIDGALSGAEVK